MRRLIGIIAALEALTFLIGAALHLGVELPVGFEEPEILPAAIVEGLCGIFLAIASWAVFASRPRAWATAVWAHVFSLAGVLLGIGALAAGRGPTTEANTIYHRVILVVLVAMLVLLWSRAGKRALGHPRRAPQTQ